MEPDSVVHNKASGTKQKSIRFQPIWSPVTSGERLLPDCPETILPEEVAERFGSTGVFPVEILYIRDNQSHWPNHLRSRKLVVGDACYPESTPLRPFTDRRPDVKNDGDKSFGNINACTIPAMYSPFIGFLGFHTKYLLLRTICALHMRRGCRD